MISVLDDDLPTPDPALLDAINAHVRRQMMARAARVESVCRVAWEGTPAARRWRLHLADQGFDRDPGVASWLGDLPPGHLP